MKVLLLGSNGQLGWELQRTCQSDIILTACDYPEIDFCNTTSINRFLDSKKPDCIINAAAYTAVDRAEQEKELAYRINHDAVIEIAKFCNKSSIPLVQISTDFVFSGQYYKPYKPEDAPHPKSIYGKSKLKGEDAVREIMGDHALIIRTAWLYSSHGNNFVKTMLKLMNEKSSINVIEEQIGTPTWAYGLALAIWNAISKHIKGTFHWTDAGVASWYDFAVAIQEEGRKAELIEKSIPILPCSTHQFPTPAKRPKYGVLDKTSFLQVLKTQPIHWRFQLRSMLKELI